MKKSLLGIRINNLADYEESYKELISSLKNSPHYITVNNVHTVVEGVRDRSYGELINNAHMALPDGKPLSVVARLKGEKRMGRIFGPTFLEKSLEYGAREGIKHFFFGSSEGTLAKMKDAINKRFPGANVVGMVSPPYRELTEEENESYINQINESGADLIWIGLGAPRQERWMAENYKKLNRGIMIGIGAGFDYLAGNTKHAPKWMKDFALEWLYRLIQEPGRLWKRYLVTNSLFILYTVLEFTGLKKFD